MAQQIGEEGLPGGFQGGMGKSSTALLKRFYKTVEVCALEDQFTVLLDGKTVKTPGHKPLLLPTEALARLVGEEFFLQEKVINPRTMPVTRLVNTVLDGVISHRDALVEDLLRFSGSDCLCYRAEAPMPLVHRQEEIWDPILDWIRHEFDAPFIVTTGLVYVQQPKEAIDAIKYFLRRIDCPFHLGALHMMTGLMGSIFLSLALYKDHLTLQEAWEAALLDEDWVAEQWGRDSEQEKVRLYNFQQLKAAYKVVKS